MEVRQTGEYARWFARLRDRQARLRIDIRVRRLSVGLSGDSRTISGSLRELRIDYGPGYRIYYTHRDGEIVLLLFGGDKSRQASDIERARSLLEALDD